jgi:hypothetical protein
MIDYFAIGLTHGLLALAALRLLARTDLDEDEGTVKPVKPWLKKKQAAPAPEHTPDA